MSEPCANCRQPAFVRAGWPVSGVGWQEADYCQTCMVEIHDRMAGAISSLALPTYTLGPVGHDIHREHYA
jgi:hypothetical protein